MVEIPSIFYSYDDEAPFETCMCCGVKLKQSGGPYMVEKGFRNQGDGSEPSILFELAICMACARDMHQALSKESVGKIHQFLQNEVRLPEHMLLQKSTFDLNQNQWMQQCVASGKPIEQMTEYQAIGMFWGEHMLLDGGPYMIGGDAMEYVQSLMSAKTKDEMDGFIDDLTGPSPELKALLHEKVVLF